MKRSIECLTCRKCGKIFTEEEHATKLCDDDVCRDCHTEDFTFEDCWIHHRYLSLGIFHWNEEKFVVGVRCPRCNERGYFDFGFINGKLNAKCPNCDFEKSWKE